MFDVMVVSVSTHCSVHTSVRLRVSEVKMHFVLYISL